MEINTSLHIVGAFDVAMENVFPAYYKLYTKYLYCSNQHYGNLPDPFNSHYPNLSIEANEPEAAATFKLILVLLVFQNFYNQIISRFVTNTFFLHVTLIYHQCTFHLKGLSMFQWSFQFYFSSYLKIHKHKLWLSRATTEKSIESIKEMYYQARRNI